MSTRRIEWTEMVRIHDGEHQPGDRTTYPKAEADQYIGLGWAKCVETGETGERKPGANGPLSVDKVTQEVGAK